MQLATLFRLLTLLLVWLLLPLGGPRPAYSADPLVELPGSLPPVAARAAPADSSRPREVGDESTLELTVVLAPRDEGGLRARASAVRRGTRQAALWAGEFARRHAPSKATVDQVRTYLGSHGLTITYQSADRLMIGARGPRAAAETAFNTTTSYLSVGDRGGYVNTAPLRVPTSLAGAIKAVAGFNQLSGKQLLAKPKPIDGGRRAPDAADPSDPYLLFNPHTIRKAYNVDALGLNGQGAQLAIILWASPTTSPTVAFNEWGEQFGFTNLDVSIHGQEMYPYVTDDARKEADMNVQLALAAAPRATIRFHVAAADTDSALLRTTQQAIDDGAHVISNSWGQCETDVAPDMLAAWHEVYTAAAAKGITVVAASGDKGLFQCGTSEAEKGIAIHPASDPLVNAVGGTTLSIDQATLSWAGEVGWSCNDTFTPSSPGACSKGSSGGGASEKWSKLDYQSGRGGGSMRIVPDYSSNADPDSGMFVLLGGFPDQPIAPYLAGGTSAAAPWVAGLLALAVQGNGGQTVGDPRPVLYDDPTEAGLYDITVGYNGASASGGFDRVTGLGSIRDAARFISALVPGLEPPPPAAQPKLLFTIQPSGGAAGTPLAFQPAVGARDADGRVLTEFAGPVTIQLKPGSGPSGATLSGTTTLTPIGGVASFTNLSIDKPGSGYVLVASAPNSQSVESVPFAVSAAPPIFKPNAYFPAVKKGVNGGSNLVDPSGQGNGGQNALASAGDKVKPGKTSKPVKFAIRNDGNVADAFQIGVRLANGQALPPGLNISVSGLASGAITGQLAAGAVQSREIRITTPPQTPIGSYKAIIDVISQSDAARRDSVTLYFQVK